MHGLPLIAVTVLVLLGLPSSVGAQEPASAPAAAVTDLTTLPPPAVATEAVAAERGPVERTEPTTEAPSVFTRWWFWTAAGILVAGAIVLGVALQPRDPSCPPATTCL